MVTSYDINLFQLFYTDHDFILKKALINIDINFIFHEQNYKNVNELQVHELTLSIHFEQTLLNPYLKCLQTNVYSISYQNIMWTFKNCLIKYTCRPVSQTSYFGSIEKSSLYSSSGQFLPTLKHTKTTIHAVFKYYYIYGFIQYYKTIRFVFSDKLSYCMADFHIERYLIYFSDRRNPS